MRTEDVKYAVPPLVRRHLAMRDLVESVTPARNGRKPFSPTAAMTRGSDRPLREVFRAHSPIALHPPATL